MAVTRIHGRNGSVTFASGYVLHCFRWSINRILETADGTPLGAWNRTKDPGVADLTGNFSCYADQSTGFADVIAQSTGAPIRGAATFTLYSTTRKITLAQILITGIQTEASLDSNIIYVFDFVLNGDDGALTDVQFA